MAGDETVTQAPRLPAGVRVVSLNVGLAAQVLWEGRTITTGFRKKSVPGRLRLGPSSLEGDEQADRSVHGGPKKSVYVYPSEHYEYWSEKLDLPDLSWGAFGENLTTSGWLETDARVADRVRIGTAELEVTQPRGPCYKMSAIFGRDDMIDRFLQARRSGFYLGVVAAGEIGPGDPIELLSRVSGSPSIAQLLDRNNASRDD
jgi:MOSC domain-containing protein YiiM